MCGSLLSLKCLQSLSDVQIFLIGQSSHSSLRFVDLNVEFPELRIGVPNEPTEQNNLPSLVSWGSKTGNKSDVNILRPVDFGI